MIGDDATVDRIGPHAMARVVVRVVPPYAVDGEDVIVFAVADLERGDARVARRERERHQVHVELDDGLVVVHIVRIGIDRLHARHLVRGELRSEAHLEIANGGEMLIEALDVARAQVFSRQKGADLTAKRSFTLLRRSLMSLPSWAFTSTRPTMRW